MASPLSALLSLGLFLSLGIGVEDIFTSPSLWAEPGTLAPMGTNVSLWCRGPAGAKQYNVPRLKRSEYSNLSWPQAQAEFLISPVGWEDAGLYSCRYWSQSGWSKSSQPLELVVTGIYKKPTLLAMPSPLVGTGEEVTLQCEAESGFDRFALYKEGDAHTSSSYEWRTQANFTIPAVTRAHGGTYRCYSFSDDSRYHWSAPSDPLELIVIETSPRPGTQEDQVEASSGLPRLWEGILTGVSVLFTLLFLFFLLYHQHLARFKTKAEGREAEGKETLKSSTGAMQEQILYTAVKNSTQNRPESAESLDSIQQLLSTDWAGDLQEVSYTQLTHPSLRRGPSS